MAQPARGEQDRPARASTSSAESRPRRRWRRRCTDDSGIDLVDVDVDQLDHEHDGQTTSTIQAEGTQRWRQQRTGWRERQRQRQRERQRPGQRQRQQRQRASARKVREPAAARRLLRRRVRVPARGTRRATSHEVARYRSSDEIPLVGVVHQAGSDYLYQCVLGQTEEVNIWLYTPLLPSERAAIEAAGSRKADELFARYSRRDGRLAIAHNSVGVIAVRPLKADSDATVEVGVLFSALRDYLQQAPGRTCSWSAGGSRRHRSSPPDPFRPCLRGGIKIVITCSLRYLPQKRGVAMDKPVALITGASQGLGRALAEALAAQGWRLVIDARHADRLDAAAAVARREHRSRSRSPATSPTRSHRAELVAAVERFGRLDLLVNNASTLGASPLPPLDVDRSRRAPHDLSRSTSSPHSRSSQALLPFAGSEQGHGRQHHVRRRGRGLRGLGRLRLVEGRARAPLGDPRRRASRAASAGGSTPATCAPRCTKTRSPARTSPIGRSPSRSSPSSSRLIGSDAARAGALGSRR